MSSKAFHTFEVDKRKVTLCIKQDTLRDRVAIGYSVCVPEDDFNETLSRKISEGRADNPRSRLGYATIANYLSSNYGVLKSIAILWESRIKEDPTSYIKGIR